jgi:CcmD family protein
MSILNATFSHPAFAHNVTSDVSYIASVDFIGAQADDAFNVDLQSSDAQATDPQASADSLNQAYSEIWQGADTGSASGLEKALGSNGLIFVVLTVSLIIWSVLLTYIIRLDRNVSSLERRLASGRDGSDEPTTKG